MKQILFLLIGFVIFAGGVLIGRVSKPTAVPSSSVRTNRSVIAENGSTTSGVVDQKPAKAPATDSDKRKRRSNLRQQGDEFKLGPLEARFIDEVVRRYKGHLDEHFEVTFELSNSTEGRVFSPVIQESAVRDDFGNSCRTEVVTGSFKQLFGGRESVDLKPNEKTTFTLRIWPKISTATSFSGFLAFDGVQDGGWSRPKIRFSIDGNTNFSEHRFEDDHLDHGFVELGQVTTLDGISFTVEKVELVDVESDHGSNQKFYLVTSKLTNLDTEKTVSPYVSIEASSHSGNRLAAWTASVPGDESGKKLGFEQHATLKDYVAVPDEPAVLYCTVRITKSYFGANPTTVQLRISPVSIKTSQTSK